MRVADPFWEAKRPATSYMYQARINTQGQIDASHRMQEWLEQLPDPEHRQSRPSQELRVQNNRPRSLSAPAAAPRPTTRPTTDPTPGVAKQSPIRRFHHPNPLAQHPVLVEKPQPLPFKVPQRKSSLQHGLRASQPIPQPTSTQQQGDLVQGIQSIQLGEPVQFNGGTQLENQPNKDTTTMTTQLRDDIEMADGQQPTSGARPVSASKRHTVQFGEIMEELKAYLPVVNMQTRDRPEVSNSMITHGE